MRPPAESRVVAVVDALVDLAQTIDYVSVIDGDENVDTQHDVIAIGYSNDLGIVVTSEVAPGFGDAYTETINVICSLWSWSGSNGYAERRARCVDLLRQLRLLIEADNSLSGACGRATFGLDQSWKQDLTDDGAFVAVGFSIQAITDV